MGRIDSKKLKNIFIQNKEINNTEEITTSINSEEPKKENALVNINISQNGSDIDIYDNNDYEIQEIPPAEVIRNPEALPINTQNIDSDIDYALRSQANVIEKTQQLINIALQQAANGGSPRDIEVAANSISVLTDANTKLLEMHEKAKKIKQVEDNKLGTGNTFVQNKIEYIGSREDALRAIRNKEFDL